MKKKKFGIFCACGAKFDYMGETIGMSLIRLNGTFDSEEDAVNYIEKNKEQLPNKPFYIMPIIEYVK